jgi:hypothetical protein
MTLLLHGRDVASDATEGLRSAEGAETATDLLLDLPHPQIPLGQIVIKGHGKVMQKRQRLFPVPLQPVKQVLAFALLLCSPPAARWGRVLLLFFGPDLEDSCVALLIRLDLRGCQARLVLLFSGVNGWLDRHQQLLHLARPGPVHLLVDKVQLAQVMGIAQAVRSVVLPIRTEGIVHSTSAKLRQDTNLARRCSSAFGVIRIMRQLRRGSQVQPSSFVLT